MGKICIRFCDKHLICLISSFLQNNPKTGIFNSILFYKRQNGNYPSTRKPSFIFWSTLLSVRTKTLGFRGSAECQVSQTDGILSSWPGSLPVWAFSTADSASGAGLGGASSNTSRRAESPRRSAPVAASRDPGNWYLALRIISSQPPDPQPPDRAAAPTPTGRVSAAAPPLQVPAPPPILLSLGPRLCSSLPGPGAPQPGAGAP